MQIMNKYIILLFLINNPLRFYFGEIYYRKRVTAISLFLQNIKIMYMKFGAFKILLYIFFVKIRVIQLIFLMKN